jgi:hypothetical protein
MRLHHVITITAALAIVSTAQAFELIVIQAVSSSRKTFITRNGKRQGHAIGMTGTFTAEEVSLIAKAVSVTGNFTQWEVSNPEMKLPFEKGAIVTYYPATEYVWALSTEVERKKYIKSMIPEPRQSFSFKGAITRGLSESVSDAPADDPNRGGAMGEIFYEYDVRGLKGLAFDVGLRYEREVVNYTTASFTTSRALLIGDVLYYFDVLKEYIPGRIYLGGGFGYGASSTTTEGLTQSGGVRLLPTMKMGITYPFNYDWDFLVEGAFESLQTVETQEGGNRQTTTQTNFKSAIGLRRYF